MTTTLDLYPNRTFFGGVISPEFWEEWTGQIAKNSFVSDFAGEIADQTLAFLRLKALHAEQAYLASFPISSFADKGWKEFVLLTDRNPVCRSIAPHVRYGVGDPRNMLTVADTRAALVVAGIPFCEQLWMW